MHWTPSDQVDKRCWNQLVIDSRASVFSLSTYIDAVADNWGVLWNDNRSGGIICPFTLRMGVKTLYAPFFHRYIEWVGEGVPAAGDLLAELKSHFPVSEAQLKWGHSFPNAPEKMHQVLIETRYNPNQQAVRMLKKAARFEVGEDISVSPLIELLKNELSPRVATIDGHTLVLLRDLVESLDATILIQLNLFESGSWKGGIWLLKFNGRMLYLKGTVQEEAKKNGGMYRLMNEAIQMAIKENLLFDFGGSNVEGVRRFNLNWGSEDQFYHRLHWNNAPLWWKTIKSVRNKWKK